MKKACLIIPYYGKWPIYIQHYLTGCKLNPWLNILFITDLDPVSNSPTNVSYINRSFKQIEAKAAEVLSLDKLQIVNAYKLCDLRPLYAEIFKEEIVEYEYWGFGDCDLIYGNMLKFISDDFDKSIDVISFNEQRNSGSFLLLKNTKKINELYLNLENYVELLKDDKSKCIDEVCYQWDETNKLNLSKSCLTYWIAHETENKSITSSYKNRIVEKVENADLIKYDNGQITFNGKEIAYFHFVFNKDQPIFSFPDWKITPKTFFVNEVGFFKSQKIAGNVRLIQKYLLLSMYYLKKLPGYTYRKLSNA